MPFFEELDNLFFDIARQKRYSRILCVSIEYFCESDSFSMACCLFGVLLELIAAGLLEGRRYNNGRYSTFLKSDKRVNSQHTDTRVRVIKFRIHFAFSIRLKSIQRPSSLKPLILQVPLLCNNDAPKYELNTFLFNKEHFSINNLEIYTCCTIRMNTSRVPNNRNLGSKFN